MLRTLSAAAGTVGFLAFSAIAHANTKPSATEMFTPTQNDLALTNLRTLLGCVVDGVWTAASGSDDRPLTMALGTFNVACLIVATILACYLLYSLVADTANDGQPFGRATNARYTLLRVMTGAILALPIKSGLSLVQILVVQIAVWGSGFGDTLWTRVAQTQLTGMYGSLVQPTPYEGDFVLRGKLAKTLEGRLYGHVCAKALQQYADNLSGGTGSTAAIRSDFLTDTPVYGLSEVTTRSHYFRDGNRYFRNSSSMCGAVKYEYIAIKPNLSDSNDSNVTRTLTSLAAQQSLSSFSSAMGSLDSAASTIANAIVAGNRDDIAIRTAIKSAIDSAYNQVNQSLRANNNTQLQTAIRNYLTASTDNGWLSAALWQRSMTAVQSKILMSSAGITGSITITPPDDITTYIPFFGHSGSAYIALAEKAQRDLTYVVGFAGYFTAQGQGSVSPVTADTEAKEYSATGLIGKSVAAMYSGIFGQFAKTQPGVWKDPVIEAQEIGYTISYYSMGSAALGATANVGGAFVRSAGSTPLTMALGTLAGGAMDGIASGLYFLTGILFAAAFLLIGVVPFLILVHFLFAAFNWFLVIAEAMVAVPIWLLTKFMPARSDSFVGNSGRGYMFFLGILIRPALVIVGLLFSLLLMRVGFDIAHMFFRGALAMIAPDGSIATAFIGAAGIFIYALVLFTIILMAAGQISALPETVLGWIDAQIERRSGSQAGIQAAAIMLPSNPSQLARSAAAGTVKSVVDRSRKAGATALTQFRGGK